MGEPITHNTLGMSFQSCLLSPVGQVTKIEELV